jgi:hypothetical protein
VAAQTCKAGCGGKKDLPSHFCYWHKVDRLPIDEQIEYAMARRELALKSHEVRGSVPAAGWPPGRRFCSGCQFMVPMWYTQGSKCKACASHASYGSHLANTFHISYDTYLAMLKFQDYRCYICRKRPLKKRLAVDHDHESGKLRGLLCSGERSCNHDVLGNIKDLTMAQRIVTYLQTPPYELMLAGQPMPLEVASAGPGYRGVATTIIPESEQKTGGLYDLMKKQAAEAVERRAKAAYPHHYHDGQFFRWSQAVWDSGEERTILNAQPDTNDLKVWERRKELFREKRAARAAR